jgi:signal transduction histidine kinase
LATLASLAVVELLSRGPVPVHPLVTVTLLISTLAAVAFAAFGGGVLLGLASAALVGLYTIHWSSPPGTFVELSAQQLQGGVVMFVIGAVVASVVGTLKSRSDRVASEALHAERKYAEDLRRANQELRRANEALEAFTYLVSHDLKEPVRTAEMLLGFLEHDHAAKLDADGVDLLRRTRRSNERLSRLLASLLDLSRASRVDPAEVTPVDVAAVVQDEACAVRYQVLARERGAKIDFAVGPGARVLATPAAVAQVFGNLVANAIAHNPSQPPEVRVRAAEPSKPELRAFVVEDNGKGFPPTFIDRFRHKESVPSSTRDGGFGLIIARRAIERLGGGMDLDVSKDLGGALVRVELPAGDGATSRAEERR